MPIGFLAANLTPGPNARSQWSPVWRGSRVNTQPTSEGPAKLYAMSDTRSLVVAIIGTGLAVITVHVAVMSMLIGSVNARIDDVRTDLDQHRVEMRKDIAEMRQRLRAVELAFGKVDQRLLTIERVVLPAPPGE